MKLTWEAGPDHVRLGLGYVQSLATCLLELVTYYYVCPKTGLRAPLNLPACSRIELSITPQACGAELDMVFMLDGSRSIAGSLQADAGFRNFWDKQARTCCGACAFGISTACHVLLFSLVSLVCPRHLSPTS